MSRRCLKGERRSLSSLWSSDTMTRGPCVSETSRLNFFFCKLVMCVHICEYIYIYTCIHISIATLRPPLISIRCKWRCPWCIYRQCGNWSTRQASRGAGRRAGMWSSSSCFITAQTVRTQLKISLIFFFFKATFTDCRPSQMPCRGWRCSVCFTWACLRVCHWLSATWTSSWTRTLVCCNHPTMQGRASLAQSSPGTTRCPLLEISWGGGTLKVG